jgi:predicted transcriptional regulator of viral defense system
MYHFNIHSGFYNEMNIFELYHIVQREEVDYLLLMGLLKNYSNPRMKINRWLANNELIRVKKGIYVFGPKVSKGLYSLKLLANWIYGPSVLSLHYALAFYGFIPERVYLLTSVTPKKS